VHVNHSFVGNCATCIIETDGAMFKAREVLANGVNIDIRMGHDLC
jgi:hypothetical protein